MFPYIRLGALVLGFAAVGLVACGSDSSTVDDDSDLSTAKLNATWIYNGPLPELEEPEVFISMKAHTARVTGFVPQGFDESKLPFYAMRENVDGKTKITVMYPVASGKPGAPHPNNDYRQVFTDPHHTTEGHFGGFPFVGYTGLIGMHGPITEDGPQWVLNRGQVSNGCNRMQGEHVVEVAHILGMNMSQPLKSAPGDRAAWKHFNVDLHVHPVFDVVGDTAYDVDFPVTENTNVVLPKADGHTIKRVLKFPTWSADDYPASVCAYKGEATPIPADYCARQIRANDASLYREFHEVTTPTVVRPFQGRVLH